jgi:hypothetical protein
MYKLMLTGGTRVAVEALVGSFVNVLLFFCPSVATEAYNYSKFVAERIWKLT